MAAWPRQRRSAGRKGTDMKLSRLFGLICLLGLAAAAFGCKPAQPALSEPQIDSRTGISLDRITADCVARCQRNDAYGLLTRNGCVYACEEIGLTFRLNGRVYPTLARCEEAVRGIDELAFLEDYDEMCLTYSDNIHRQSGCLDGVRFYYELLDPASACRPYSSLLVPGLEGKTLAQ